MIKIYISANRIEVLGHAPRADDTPPGQNIVCAAVSALTLTLIEGLEAVAGMEIKTKEAAGSVRITWAEMSAIGEALVQTWRIGITRIRDSYENTILLVSA